MAENYTITKDQVMKKGTHMFVYDDKYIQLVNQNTGLFVKREDDEEVSDSLLNCTRARYVGKDIFIYVKSPGIVGVINMKTGANRDFNVLKNYKNNVANRTPIEDSEDLVSKLNSLTIDNILETACIKDKHIQTILPNGEELWFGIESVPGVQGLDVPLKYIMTGTPVLASELRDSTIWKVGRVIF